MIFCGYKNPEAIVKLKNQKEVAKMFNTVIQLEELIPEHERDQMFGIFKKNPSLLKILPGIKPRFQSFVRKVENLLPGKTSTKKRPVSKPILNEAKPTGKHRPLEADLTERLRRWFQKELPNRAVDVSIEIAISTFTFKENANGSFTFNCLKCKTQYIIPNAEPTKISISNATRLIINKCWLNEKKKPKLDKLDSTQSTVPSYFIGPVQKRIFVPRNSDSFDFVTSTVSNIVNSSKTNPITADETTDQTTADHTTDLINTDQTTDLITTDQNTTDQTTANQTTHLIIADHTTDQITLIRATNRNNTYATTVNQTAKLIEDGATGTIESITTDKNTKHKTPVKTINKSTVKTRKASTSRKKKSVSKSLKPSVGVVKKDFSGR